jgi:hypothetical protein
MRGVYPYGLVPGQNDGKTVAQNIDIVDVADRTRVLAIPANHPDALTTAISNMQTTLQASSNQKYLVSGILTAVAGVGATGEDITTNGSAIIQTDNDDKTQRYIDIELVDVRPGSKGYGSISHESISGYLELAVGNSSATDPGVDINTTYLYTKDKHGFNDFLRMATPQDVLDGAMVPAAAGGFVAATAGEPIYRTGNANIKKVSLKPGVNDIYLSFFSHAAFNE